MPIETIITEAKKITPTSLFNAHAWLQDLLTTHHQLHDPIAAIRFFILGLFTCDAISLDVWYEFDSLIATKNKENLH